MRGLFRWRNGQRTQPRTGKTSPSSRRIVVSFIAGRWGDTLLTLRNFFEAHFLSNAAVLQELNRRTIVEYELSVRYWEAAVGPIGINAITRSHVDMYRRYVASLPGRRGRETISPYTIRKHVTNLRRLLVAASEPSYTGRYGPYGESLIRSAPVVPTPRVPRRRPKPTYSVDEVRRMLAAATSQRRPRLPGTTPAEWWRTILLTACYTGLRRGTLLALRKSWVKGDRLLIPAEAIKGHWSDLVVALTPDVSTAIRAIRGVPGDMVFGWQTDTRNLNRHLRAIYDRAGLDPERWYAWHGFRRYVASELTRVAGVETASRMLGHTHLSTTRQHYASLEAQLDESLRVQQLALLRLPRLI